MGARRCRDERLKDGRLAHDLVDIGRVRVIGDRGLFEGA